MNRPVEDYAIARVMADWQLNNLLKFATDSQAITIMMRAFGYSSREIAAHQQMTPQGISYQLRTLRKKLKSDSGVI